jgi:arsenate reductase
MKKDASYKRKILFVCYGNMIRSQMAEGFARDFGGSFLDVYSAGLSPTGLVAHEAILAMREKGIDISKQRSKGLRDVPLAAMDYIVSLLGRSARQFCPPDFAGQTIDWYIHDPIGKHYDVFIEARDDIEKRVKELVKTIWKEGDETGNTS